MFTLSLITSTSVVILYREWAAEFSDVHTVVSKPEQNIDTKVDKVWRALSVARKTGEVWLRAESEWLTPRIVKVEGSVKWWVDYLLGQNWKQETIHLAASWPKPSLAPISAQTSSVWSSEEEKARFLDAAQKEKIALGKYTIAQEDLRTKADKVAKTHIEVDALKASVDADANEVKKLSLTAFSESIAINKQISPARQIAISASGWSEEMAKIKFDAISRQDEILRKTYTPLTPDLEKSVVDYFKDNKDSSSLLFLSSKFSQKLDEWTLTAQELLDNDTFIRSYGNSVAGNLSEIDKKDYEFFTQIIKLVSEVDNKDFDLTLWQMSLEKAEIEKQSALDEYMESAVWIRSISDEYNEAQANLNSVRYIESDTWKVDISNDWNEASVADIIDHPDGYQMLLEWDNSVGGSNMYLQKQWDNLILTFSNGDTFRIDGQGESQLKQIEFIRSLNDIPTMRMLIGMWSNSFSEFSKMLAIKNPMATMENPKIFINNTMQILGWIIGESENDMPKDFSIWKEIDQWIRDYMTPTRTEDWRKTLKATGIMKEDNSLEAYTFMESAKRIIL